MLWRRLTGQRVERIVVPLNHISPALLLAVIVAEDGSFCHNRGIDLGAIRDAMKQSEDIGEARGASTLIQGTRPGDVVRRPGGPRFGRLYICQIGRDPVVA